jgi:hypothetical protein
MVSMSCVDVHSLFLEGYGVDVVLIIANGGAPLKSMRYAQFDRHKPAVSAYSATRLSGPPADVARRDRRLSGFRQPKISPNRATIDQRLYQHDDRPRISRSSDSHLRTVRPLSTRTRRAKPSALRRREWRADLSYAGVMPGDPPHISESTRSIRCATHSLMAGYNQWRIANYEPKQTFRPASTSPLSRARSIETVLAHTDQARNTKRCSLN